MRNRSPRTLALAGTLLAGLMPAYAAPNVIVNGSFEQPIAGNGNFRSFSAGDSGIPGWTITGPGGTAVAIVDTNFSQNGVTFNAADGVQWLDLTGVTSNVREGVAQVFATIPGEVYSIVFDLGNTTGGFVFGTQSDVSIEINGVDLVGAPVVNADPDPTGLAYEEFTIPFTAATALTTLGFINDDPSSDNSNALDNVRVFDSGVNTSRADGQAVPEPASVLVLGLGLLGAAVVRRRRH